VGKGETRVVRTGAGTFSFLSDKKAAILVGTPTSCTVVGYWVRDEDGENRSDHFFAQLPASTSFGAERMVVWGVGTEPTHYTITDHTSGRALASGTLAHGQRYEVQGADLSQMSGHELEIQGSAKALMVQVYQDEGFTVPSTTGGGMGREFFTFVGAITEGVNDLNLVSYYAGATVKVEDLDSHEVLWSGAVPAGGVHTLTLANHYVKVTSDQAIQVIVAPYAHYTGAYAEHHFGMGIEGGAIDTDFMLPTTTELWVFSYYAGNHVNVSEIGSGKTVWEGEMTAGSVHGLQPGHGFYRVQSNHGISVMGGALACGAEYSPAAGLFKVDEALLAAVVEIKKQRVQAAATEGRTLTDEGMNAPLSATELDEATRAVRETTGDDHYSPAEAAQRLDSMVTH